jgi:hypothetical protein
MSEISSRELDLIIKELERLNNCYVKLNDSINARLDKECGIMDVKVDGKIDKSTEKWKYLLIFGSYGFTMFVLGLFLQLHLGVK